MPARLSCSKRPAFTHARAVLITVPAFADVRNIVRAARQIRPDLPIIARADGIEAVRALYALGIQEVTSPEFEAAIEMTRQALMYFNVPAHDVLRVASAIRHERYDMKSESGASGLAIMSQIGEIARHLEFTWVGVPPDSPFDGRTLDELRIRSTIGASVVGDHSRQCARGKSRRSGALARRRPRRVTRHARADRPVPAGDVGGRYRCDPVVSGHGSAYFTSF